jgi:hypothetical protein
VAFALSCVCVPLIVVALVHALGNWQ